MSTNVLDETRTSNAEPPKWLILHRPLEPQRRSWGADMARLVDDLIRCDWVVWREGHEVHVKHRAWVHQ